MNIPTWLRKALTSPYAYSLIVILGFGIVYAASLTFVYSEGDDATTILHHVFGRDNTIWPVYVPYQGMMDALLNLLPVYEPILRIFSISLSALAGVVFTILALLLIFEWLEIEHQQKRAMIAFASLLAFPELFFLGLIYNPSLIGMAFVLGAHLLARRLPLDMPWQRTGKAWIVLLCSALLFGFGISFRWPILSYGLVVVVDLIFYKTKLRPILTRSLVNRVAVGGIWGIAALLAALLCIVLSGQISYLISGTVGMAGLIEKLLVFSMFSFFGLQTLITPVVVLLACVGIILLFRRRPDLFLIVLAGGVTILPVVKYGVTKMIITCVPVVMLCMIQGLDAVLRYRTSHRWLTGFVRLGVIFLMLMPWFVGVKFHSTDSLWGPGFELRMPGVDTTDSKTILFNASVLRQSFPITGISVAVGDGMALSTSEGPRPLGAYGAVLLGGGWRAFVLERDGEMQDIVMWAITHEKPLLIENRSSMIFAKIVANGYRLVDAPPYDEHDLKVYRYTFENDSGGQLAVYYLDQRTDLFKVDRARELMPILGEGQIPLYTAYTSTLQKIYDIAPQSVNVQSPFTALFDLGAYLDALK